MHAILNRPSRVLQIAAAMFLLVAFATAARADIFQWEYINPADPSQGKQQSTTLAPDGAGVDAVPGADLSDRNLTMAYLIGADLTNANGYRSESDQRRSASANLDDATSWTSILGSSHNLGPDAEAHRATLHVQPASRCAALLDGQLLRPMT